MLREGLVDLGLTWFLNVSSCSKMVGGVPQLHGWGGWGLGALGGMPAAHNGHLLAELDGPQRLQCLKTSSMTPIETNRCIWGVRQGPAAEPSMVAACGWQPVTCCQQEVCPIKWLKSAKHSPFHSSGCNSQRSNMDGDWWILMIQPLTFIEHWKATLKDAIRGLNCHLWRSWGSQWEHFDDPSSLVSDQPWWFIKAYGWCLIPAEFQVLPFQLPSFLLGIPHEYQVIIIANLKLLSDSGFCIDAGACVKKQIPLKGPKRWLSLSGWLLQPLWQTLVNNQLSQILRKPC